MTDDPVTAAPEDNSHAGQGSVVVDIGGDYGALVIHTAADLERVEIEIRPTGDTPYADEADLPDHGHDHGHDHGDDHDHPHEHSGEHHHLLHVAVLRRPSPGPDPRYAAVFPSLHRGTYELYRRPAEPVAMTVTIVGAEVTEVHWPEGR